LIVLPIILSVQSIILAIILKKNQCYSSCWYFLIFKWIMYTTFRDQINSQKKYFFSSSICFIRKYVIIWWSSGLQTVLRAVFKLYHAIVHHKEPFFWAVERRKIWHINGIIKDNRGKCL